MSEEEKQQPVLSSTKRKIAKIGGSVVGLFLISTMILTSCSKPKSTVETDTNQPKVETKKKKSTKKDDSVVLPGKKEKSVADDKGKTKKDSSVKQDIGESVLSKYQIQPTQEGSKKNNSSNLLLAMAEQTELDKQPIVKPMVNKPSVVEVEKPVEKPPVIDEGGDNNGHVKPPVVEVVSYPTIETVSNSEIVIVKGELFNLDNYYQVRDSIDSNPLVIVKGEVNPDKEGHYYLTITAINQFGNQAKETLHFYVNSPAVFETVKDTTDIMIESAEFDPIAYIKATHQLDGDITKQVTVIDNEVKINELGTYEVSYKVVDSKGTPSFYSQDFTVTNHAPVIHGVKDLKFDVGTELTKESLLQGIYATDREDDYLNRPLAVVVDDEQLQNIDTTKPGDYHLTYQVTDSHGLKTTKSIKVTIQEKEVVEPIEPVEPTVPEEPKEPGTEVESEVLYKRGNIVVTSSVQEKSVSELPYEVKNK
ncbi:immunoglobulin-like domain-containing protein [Vagococcus fluvialis]|uniref:immunoglobulin-like domain-containing protein n=1 Tax=Vagococcus fluvialis TaxID=2738 RepID=UPI003B5AC181